MIKNIFKYGVKKRFYIYVIILLFCTGVFIDYLNDTNNDLDSISEEIVPTSVLEPIVQEDIVKQDFICDNDTIEGISLFFGTYARQNDSNINVLLKSDGIIVEKWILDSGQLIDNSYHDFLLKTKVVNSRGKIYTIEITSDAVVESNAVTLYKNDSVEENNLTLNDIVVENSKICFKVIYNIVDSTIVLKSCLLLGFLVIIVCSFLINRKRQSVEKVFLVLFIITGLLFSVVMPLFKVPDESMHFLRAYEISEGYMLTSIEDNIAGRELPQNIIPDQLRNGPNIKWYNVFAARNQEAENDNIFYAYPNTALYSPVSYLPQSLGIFIVKLFSNNVIAMAYGGRLLNWLFVLIITYFSIKLIPIGKNILLLIALLPMNIHQSISLSPDGFINVLSFAMVAFVLNVYFREEKMNTKNLIIMYTLIISIALCKIVYVPFCLLLFLLPNEKFRSKENYYKNILMSSICVLVTSIGWLTISSRYLIEFNQGVDGVGQVKFILSHPIHYTNILIKTILTYGESYFYTMIGSQLGWLNININHVILLLYTLLMGIVVLYEKDKFKFELKLKDVLLIAGITVLTFLLVMTSLYVQWTKVGNNVIEGIQGRYFIPLLLPFSIIIKTISNNETKKIPSMNYIYSTVLFINVCVVMTVFYNCI